MTKVVFFDHSLWSMQFRRAFKFESTLDFIPLNQSKAFLPFLIYKRFLSSVIRLASYCSWFRTIWIEILSVRIYVRIHIILDPRSFLFIWMVVTSICEVASSYNYICLSVRSVGNRVIWTIFMFQFLFIFMSHFYESFFWVISESHFQILFYLFKIPLWTTKDELFAWRRSASLHAITAR